MPSSSPSLSPPPAADAPIHVLSTPPPEVEARNESSSSSPVKPDPEDGPIITDEKKLEEAKKRHQEDVAKHAIDGHESDRPQDDWQVAYVWAFIVKFHQRDKIRRLECLEDFERSLMEPIPNRPDDIIEGILVRFLGNLKPGLRNLDCTNVQAHLTAYIHDHLVNSSEFTVWDRPWGHNEEARGACCLDNPDRTELGRLRYPGEPPLERAERNPLRQIEKRGGGLFELDWRERARIMRQLVDWQLTYSDPIRAVINSQHGLTIPKGVKVADSHEKVAVEPIGLDRNKNRIWAFDNSGRLWQSGNPFKRPCPIKAISSNRTELAEQVDRWKAHGESSTQQNGGKAKSKTKPTKAEQQAARKAAKGIEQERELAAKVGDMLEAVEKEEQRIIRARKRTAEVTRLVQQAEFRSTRTRRTTKKIDYTYDGFDDEEEDFAPRRGRGNAAYEPVQPSRPIIPGERKSARQAAKEEQAYEAPAYNPNDDLSDASSEVDSGDGANDDQVDEDSHSSKRRRTKGYEWVEEAVPAEQPGDVEGEEDLTRKNRQVDDAAMDPDDEDAPGVVNGGSQESDAIMVG